MTDRRSRSNRHPDRQRATVEDFFECTLCRAAYEEWIEDCPDCEGLVVRVVDRSG